MKRMTSKPRQKRGNALVEFALVLPLLFLLIVNVVNFGGMLFAWIAVTHATRTGAQYLAMGPSTVGEKMNPSVSNATTGVAALVSEDLHALPNSASASVRVCINNNGTITCNVAGGSPPADPEPALFITGTVEVTYTYTPFISAWSFPGLHIFATLPPTTIHRMAVMRLLGGTYVP